MIVLCHILVLILEGAKVKEVCKILGITQNQLAELMGLHYTAFSKWKDKTPKNAEIFLNLIIENYELKQELKQIKEAVKILKEI
ncbi:XRE family transcriptional regulator [Helicobacter bilis]|uniref:XRE family transcriptional regulator n=1 Tax=Helicobacter bilis TaxID=37372 RepID=UPI001E2CF9D9|nr:XRE family transcriptional regulator [Helicobacter bilis]